MDLEYNAKLKAIMKKHNTDVWNDDCKNDPDYAQADKEMYGEAMFGHRVTKRMANPIGSVKVGSYKFKSKRK